MNPKRQQGKGVAQAVPAPAELNEQSAKQVLEAVLAQLKKFGRGVSEGRQLRADAQKPSDRIDELAAIMAGQGEMPPEDTTPAMSEESPKPQRTSQKQRGTRARIPT